MTLEEAKLDPDWVTFQLLFLYQNMVNYHDRLYYVEDAPVLSDAEYDLLYSKLEVLEAKHPDLVSLESPTHRVGGYAAKQFKKIKHLMPMRSLAKVHTEAEFIRWDERMHKLLEDS